MKWKKTKGAVQMKKLSKKSILAEGEATGHKHRLVSEVEIYEHHDGAREFTLDQPTDLVHEEHKSIALPGSVAYNSDIVREFDYFAEQARKVRKVED
jgi:hypothetical protein